jgi:TATA-box binding protein (TBP) (component of TFIID and TFIIIB)
MNCHPSSFQGAVCKIGRNGKAKKILGSFKMKCRRAQTEQRMRNTMSNVERRLKALLTGC